jgi:hypothetical protein
LAFDAEYCTTSGANLNTLKNERDEMKESLLDLKCRSINYNLVLTGLRESPHEITEERPVFSKDKKKRKPENENIPGKQLSDPQTDCCSLFLT